MADGRLSIEAPTLAGARLTIDLDAVAANWKMLDEMSGAARCGAAVKGDGYGIGLETAVETLRDSGCRDFFVALPQEGLRARSVDPAIRIFVLNGYMDGTADMLIAHTLIPVLGSMEEIADWNRQAAAAGRRLPAALHVDTGMNRLGLRVDEAMAIDETNPIFESVELCLLISHLACGSDPAHPLNHRQLSAFRDVRARFPSVSASLSNSAGIFLGPDYHYDLCRPGIALYGGAALDAHAEDNPMRPVVRSEARILQVRSVAAGDGIGYGSAETAKRDTRVAIVACGYADGYHRRAGSAESRAGAVGFVGSDPVPAIGRVSMDLTAFDVTDCPPPGPQRGDWITMLGGPSPLARVAERAETIDYELLTGLGRRYERVYRRGTE
ncbi:MAG: alanine racemase [Pseudomonadota bacterium]